MSHLFVIQITSVMKILLLRITIRDGYDFSEKPCYNIILSVFNSHLCHYDYYASALSNASCHDGMRALLYLMELNYIVEQPARTYIILVGYYVYIRIACSKRFR